MAMPQKMQLISTSYMLEPNIKECIGGMRDLNNIFWVSKKVYGISDFNNWNRVGLMVLYFIICVSMVSVLLKKGYNIKS